MGVGGGVGEAPLGDLMVGKKYVGKRMLGRLYGERLKIAR